MRIKFFGFLNKEECDLIRRGLELLYHTEVNRSEQLDTEESEFLETEKKLEKIRRIINYFKERAA